MEKLLTRKEVAEIIGVSLNSMPRIMRRIPYLKIGKMVRFRRGDVEAWLERHRKVPRRWAQEQELEESP